MGGIKPRVNHRRYWSIFLLVGGLLSGAANYSVRTVSRQVYAEQKYSQSMIISRSILVDLIDAETGLRGYLLTGQREYLRPYHEGIGRLQSDLANFKVKVPLADQVQIVEELSNKLIAEFVHQIELADKDPAESKKRFQDVPTKPILDGIRDSIATVRAVEGSALDDSRDHLRSSIETTVNLLNISTFGGLVMSLALATSLLSPPGTEDE